MKKPDFALALALILGPGIMPAGALPLPDAIEDGLTTADNLGIQGREDEARQVLEDLLAAAEKAHGPDHFFLVVILTDLAARYTMVDGDKAVANLRRAITIVERQPDDHRREEIQLARLALPLYLLDVLILIDRPQEARQTAQAIATLLDQGYSPHFADFADQSQVLDHLFGFDLQFRRLNPAPRDASKYFDLALTVAKRVAGDIAKGDLERIVVLTSQIGALAKLYASADFDEESRRIGQLNTILVPNLFYQSSDAYQQWTEANNHAQAQAVAQKLVLALQHSHGPDHYLTAIAVGLRGTASLRLGDAAAALPDLTHAVTIATDELERTQSGALTRHILVDLTDMMRAQTEAQLQLGHLTQAQETAMATTKIITRIHGDDPPLRELAQLVDNYLKYHGLFNDKDMPDGYFQLIMKTLDGKVAKEYGRLDGPERSLAQSDLQDLAQRFAAAGLTRQEQIFRARLAKFPQ